MNTTTKKYLQPLGNRVLTKALAPLKLSEIIVVPDNVAPTVPQEVIIVALGTGGTDPKGDPIKFEVAVGDEVIAPQYGGTPCRIDNNEYKIYRADELFAVVRHQ